MAGTIFQDSATSLRLWFYAIYLMSSTRCGISAKQLERELGVTYKTAWRMFNKIRSLMMQDGEGPFGGTVEADETYVGGKRRGKVGRPGAGDSKKVPVFGIAERGKDGKLGRIAAMKIPDARAHTLISSLAQRVLPASIIYTDEYQPYLTLGKRGYTHKRVHHTQKVYVKGDVHTQTVDGFWALVKNGISGVYHGVSAKHLQAYLDEYAFRYNNSGDRCGMFNAMLSRVQKTS
ncbi:MAG: IS1595 family transposase [bacterium]